MRIKIKKELSKCLFTIQNVSVKYRLSREVKFMIINLQYKMFLLNLHDRITKTQKTEIYNTKCFY